MKLHYYPETFSLYIDRRLRRALKRGKVREA